MLSLFLVYTFAVGGFGFCSGGRQTAVAQGAFEPMAGTDEAIAWSAWDSWWQHCERASERASEWLIVLRIDEYMF
jgi:hypothetical protein